MRTAEGKNGVTALEAAVEALPAYEVGEEFNYRDLAELISFNETTVSGVMSEMVRSGKLERIRRGWYARLPEPPVVPPRTNLTFELVKVRADGSRIVTDEAGELYVVTLVVV